MSQLDVLSRDIEHISHALPHIPNDHPNRPLLLARLGTLHRNRYELLGEPDDVEKAIEYGTIALSLIPEKDPGLPDLLDVLVTSHGWQFQRLGKGYDNNKAMEYAYRTVSLTPDSHPEYSRRLSNMGTVHGDRFQHLGDLGDLEKDIEYQSRALSFTAEDHRYRPGHLENLGVCLIQRFERLGNLEDLKRSIECLSRAVELTPNGHPHLPSKLSKLGSAYNFRFGRLGELGDLDRAIEYKTRAVELSPQGHPDVSTRLANLGLSHAERFLRLDNLEDLQKAIQYQFLACQLTPQNHPGLPIIVGNLGASLRYQFERLGDIEDLETAIQCNSRALAWTPDGHPYLLELHANSGVYFMSRFRRLGELGDLDKTIESQWRALALMPDGHPHLSELLQNMGQSHGDRFHRLGQQADLDKVIEYTSRALELTPQDHPRFPDRHFPLAEFRLLQYRQTGDLSQFQSSLDSYRLASQSPAGSPRDKYRYAIVWAQRAFQDKSLGCLEAYQTAIDLLPQFIWLGSTTTQRYQDLTKAQNLAPGAAYAAILSSNHTLALEWLEHARCVVWNQNLMLRSPLDQLRSSHPDLATRLQAVATQLHHAGSEPRTSEWSLSSSLSPEQVARQHRQLAQEYDSLITQTRTLSGFEDFLRPMAAHDLVRAARYGPIVVINCHEDRCDAILILPGQRETTHLSLPNYTAGKARSGYSELSKVLGGKGLRERGVKFRRPEQNDHFENVLAELWTHVIKPILDSLGYTNQSSKGSLPHVTWCPTGALTFLPLHAAGDYSQPQSRIFDYVISSYTPTLSALLAITPTSRGCDSRLLAVGLASTPDHNPLPGTIGELECVKGHAQNMVKYSQLLNDQATKKAVLDAMEQHDWVHLACHAHQNVSDPTKSGFFMHDGTLDLAAINGRSFKGKGLAFLSACQTATGDEMLPDEAVHLASGMLMGGYSSVVATMWSVIDGDAPLVANQVYAQLMQDGKLGNGEAGKALHYAVASLRQEVGEKEFGRWVPYIHIGS